MILGFIVELLVGLFCVIVGLLLWKKQAVSVLHDYHYRKVKEEDLPAYTKNMGIGLVVMGVGILLGGVLNLFKLTIWWLPMAIGFVAGFVIMHKAQMKYNGSWF